MRAALALILCLCSLAAFADQQHIFRGTLPNDHTGEPPWIYLGKIEGNFDELYGRANSSTNGVGGSPGQIQVNGTNQFSGDPSFTFNPATKVVTAGGLTISGIWLDPRDYGAAATNADNTSSIQAAINAAALANVAVFLPEGVFPIQGNLVAQNSNFSFIGVRGNKSILKRTGGSGPILTFTGGTTRIFNVFMADVSFACDSHYISDGALIANASQIYTERCQYSGCVHGLTIDGVEIFQQQNAVFGQNEYGLYLTRKQAGGFSYANCRDIGSTFYQNTNAACLVDYSLGHLSFDGTWIEATDAAILITNQINTPVEVDRLTLDKIHFQVLAASGFETGVVMHAQPDSTAAYFLINGMKTVASKFVTTSGTNFFQFLAGANLNTNSIGLNNFSLDACAFYGMTNPATAIVYADNFGVNGSATELQIQGNYPLYAGPGSPFALDARYGGLRMMDTNFVSAVLLTRTTGNDIQLTSFSTNSGLGFFVPDTTKDMYFDVGGDGNELTLQHNYGTLNGTWQVNGGSIFNANAETVHFWGTDSTYAGFYPHGGGNGRAGYFGYGAANTPHLSWVNQNPGGYLLFGTTNGTAIYVYDTGNVEFTGSSILMDHDLNVTGNFQAGFIKPNNMSHSTIAITDGTGNLVSVANGTGYLHDNGSGGFSWDASPALSYGLLNFNAASADYALTNSMSDVLFGGTPYQTSTLSPGTYLVTACVQINNLPADSSRASVQLVDTETSALLTGSLKLVGAYSGGTLDAMEVTTEGLVTISSTGVVKVQATQSGSSFSSSIAKASSTIKWLKVQ